MTDKAVASRAVDRAEWAEITAVGLAIGAAVMFFIGPHLWSCLIPAVGAIVFAVIHRRRGIHAGGYRGRLALAAFLVALIVIVMRAPAVIMHGGFVV